MSTNIKTWLERATEAGDMPAFSGDVLAPHMKAEIVDLRAENAHLTEQIEALRAALAQRTAGGDAVQKLDERASFEHSVLQRNAAYDHPPVLLERNASGNYSTVRIEGEWKGWQARAALAAQPVAEAAAQVGGWDDAIEAAAEVVIKRTRVPRDLLGPAQASHKALAATGERIAEAIRALKPAAAHQESTPKN